MFAPLNLGGIPGVEGLKKMAGNEQMQNFAKNVMAGKVDHIKELANAANTMNDLRKAMGGKGGGLFSSFF